MKKIFVFAIALFFIIGINNAFSLDKIPESFSKYNLINFSEGGKLYLAPNIVSKKSKGENEFADYDVISFNIKDDIYGIVFDPGPSEDPSFIVLVLKNGKRKEIGITSGYKLFISASGGVYSEGENNNFFNVRRKYKLTNSKLEEIKQSFLLVNYDCKASALVKIRVDQNVNSEIVAVLPKGSPIHIIASKFYFSGHNVYEEIQKNDGYPFLVSTSFGLIGWVNVKPGHFDIPGIPVDCIKFVGD